MGADIGAAAPGKIILFGEHAVVYGQPAIAVPLQAVQARATVMPGPAGQGCLLSAPDIGAAIRWTGDSESAYAATGVTDALLYPLQLALEAVGAWSPGRVAPDWIVTVRSTIPIASGLGSGAAVAAAVARAAGIALGRPFSPEALNALVYTVEQRHHGTPSGIDNTVIVYERPVYFVRGQPLETFGMARPFRLLVADTGLASPTRLSVGDVRALFEAEPERMGRIFEQIGAIVRAARRAIESGEVAALGPLMAENQALLRELTVSNETLDRLCAAACDAGATGAKLSGGGRGGNLIALVETATAGPVRAALEAAGAVRVIETTVGER